jgi:hypothetical protein
MRRFRFQYSLSTLLTATALCSIFFALFSIYHHRCMRRRAVIDHFRTKGDAVTVAFKAPSWLRRVLGDLYFEELTDLAIRKRPITANDLNHLRTIASVRTLEISDAGLSDADLLSLSDTDVRVTLDLRGPKTGRVRYW